MRYELIKINMRAFCLKYICRFPWFKLVLVLDPTSNCKRPGTFEVECISLHYICNFKKYTLSQYIIYVKQSNSKKTDFYNNEANILHTKKESINITSKFVYVRGLQPSGFPQISLMRSGTNFQQVQSTEREVLACVYVIKYIGFSL